MDAPGPPDLPPDLLIVGAGVLGLSVAFAAVRAGRRPRVLEAERVGAGASGVPAALLNPHRGRSARASDADAAGLAAAWRQIRALEGLGLDPGARPAGPEGVLGIAPSRGVLRIAPNEGRARAWRKLDGDQRTGARRLEPDHPLLTPPLRAPFGALLVGRGGAVEAPRLLAALAEAVRRGGGEVREGVRVVGLEPLPGGGWLAGTTAGPVATTRVVVATGATRTPGVPAVEDLAPVERVAGEVAGLEPLVRLPLPLAGGVYAAEAGGRIRVGGNHRPEGRADPEAPERLRASLAWSVPTLGDAGIAEVWSGVRLRAQGGEPVVREVAPGLVVAGALAGRGFLRAAAIAETYAAELPPSPAPPGSA